MKKIISLVLAVLMLAALPGQVFADEPQGKKLSVKLDLLTVETEYDTDDVYVRYERTDKEVIAHIIDKTTNKIIQSYGEEITVPNSNARSGTDGVYEFEKYYYSYFEPDGYTQIQARFKLYVYQETVGGITSTFIRELRGVNQSLKSNTANVTLEDTDFAIYQKTNKTIKIDAVGTLVSKTTTAHGFNFAAYDYVQGIDLYFRFIYEQRVSVSV